MDTPNTELKILAKINKIRWLKGMFLGPLLFFPLLFLVMMVSAATLSPIYLVVSASISEVLLLIEVILPRLELVTTFGDFFAVIGPTPAGWVVLFILSALIGAAIGLMIGKIEKKYNVQIVFKKN